MNTKRHEKGERIPTTMLCVNDPEYTPLFAEESLVLEATELICRAMERSNTSQADLARHMDTTEYHVRLWLDGTLDLELRQVARMMHVMGERVTLKSKRLPRKRGTIR